MGKHTHGAWEVKAISGEFTEDGDIIGEFRGIFPTKELSIPEMKANARLMEASPKLYEALKFLVEFMTCIDRPSNSEESRDIAIANAEKALAEAEGRDEGE